MANRQMNVIHLCTDISGGAGRAAYRLNQAIKGQGVDSTMLVQFKKGSEQSVIATSKSKPQKEWAKVRRRFKSTEYTLRTKTNQ